MEHCKYLIIGGGLAADAAIRGIREVDHAGSILAVSDEDDPPTIGRPVEGAMEGQRCRYDLAPHRVDRRRAAPRYQGRRTRSSRQDGDRCRGGHLRI